MRLIFRLKHARRKRDDDFAGNFAVNPQTQSSSNELLSDPREILGGREMSTRVPI